MDADAIIVGGGLAGLVAACELIDAGKSVLIVDQEPEQHLGGQAFWSLGGIFLVDSPEQRRMGIRDSLELAKQDWAGSAGFDRNSDGWARRWADAYVEWAAGGKRDWLRERGIRFFPIVGWAERGGVTADGPGNSVPRFHITWGTGPGIIEPFVERVQDAAKAGKLRFAFRHRVDGLIVTNGVVEGVHGMTLAPDDAVRGGKTNREEVGAFELRAQTVLVSSGGIGGNHDLVRKNWPERLGKAPEFMVSGVPEHVDGRMLGIAEGHGVSVINQDRMWHYVEGVRNWDPIWPAHGIRILPGPSSMWFDASGERMPVPNFPGFDSLTALEHIGRTGQPYTWFVLTQGIIKKEFALSGSEQNPDLTGKSWRQVLGRAIGKKAMGPVEAFKEHGADFAVADTLEELVAGMNRVGEVPVPLDRLREQIEARDRNVDNPFTKDAQMAAVHAARNYRGDRLIRTAKPHRILDPANGPLIAVRLNVLTRKSLGGIETDLGSRALGQSGEPVPGLFAAGEAAGFGGGGVHGYRSLEGTFLGGCLFSGRAAGRTMAEAV
ncbi:FAD-binding dehydrogenase [Pontivivens ytuae]|uniref:FAD-binding dehydrogenase n=1 Tax=Pontivivens ytuae TaxID=2789856 RepID=A0A7S9QEZ8_9RHOB|nr:FAD-binding dehydrogenase [Pontivivens ytuae]QPH55731.1 FAD-binding dehydrogenase [Pontivivens ytuae]